MADLAKDQVALCTRRQVRVSKVIVHENFTASVNDIALLKLGKNLSGDPLNHHFTEDRVDLSVFSPVCLPSVAERFNDQEGHVLGKQC